MVRYRVHYVIKLGKYREAMEWAHEIDKRSREKGLVPLTMWAPTVGTFNSLILEFDYRDLAHYAQEQNAFNTDKDLMAVFRSGSELAAVGHWPHDELLESAPTLA